MISIIIPVYNEAGFIGPLIKFLRTNASKEQIEILVADGGSEDTSTQEAIAAGAFVVHCNTRSRAAQMNFAAAYAKGSVLYFVHADTLPPASFHQDITDAISNGFQAGRYQTKFLSKSLLLKMNAFFTRFDLFACYGGDQTLFICHNLFKKIGGFDTTKVIMEDYDITNRIKKNPGRYKIFNKPALVSARKYKKNNWLAVQKANYAAVKMYRQGLPTAIIAARYKQMLRF